MWLQARFLAGGFGGGVGKPQMQGPKVRGERAALRCADIVVVEREREVFAAVFRGERDDDEDNAL